MASICQMDSGLDNSRWPMWPWDLFSNPPQAECQDARHARIKGSSPDGYLTSGKG